jgi:hypothetical protein
LVALSGFLFDCARMQIQAMQLLPAKNSRSLSITP